MQREIPMGVGGLPIMSRSALEIADCDFRLLSLYHPDPAKRVVDDNDYSRRGTAYHAIKKHYIRLLHEAETPMDHDLSRRAFQLGIAEAGTIPRLIPEVRELWAIASQNFALSLDAYHSTEERIVRPEAPVPYILEPDLVYAWSSRNELEVQDDKTYYVAFTDEKARLMMQTRYYIWAAMQEWPGFGVYRFTYNFVRLNQVATVTFTPDDFDILNEEIQAAESARLTRFSDYAKGIKPKAVAGDVCGFCSLNCPLYHDKSANTGLVRVSTHSEFQTWGQVLITHDKRKKALRDALKRYVTVNGPTQVGGEWFSFRPRVARSYDAATVLDRCRDKGIQPLFDVTSSGLKALFKLFPAMRDDLAAIVKEKTSAVFGHKSEKSDMTTPPDAEPDDE